MECIRNNHVRVNLVHILAIAPFLYWCSKHATGDAKTALKAVAALIVLFHLYRLLRVCTAIEGMETVNYSPNEINQSLEDRELDGDARPLPPRGDVY